MQTRDELGRVAWDAVPLAIDPVDGWNDVEAVDWAAVEAALEPGPPTWEQVQRFWPDVAESYRRLAEAVAAAARGEQAEALAAAEAVSAAVDGWAAVDEDEHGHEAEWRACAAVIDANAAYRAAKEAVAMNALEGE